MQQPFPCFAALRTQLHLEELSQTPRPGARAAAFPAGSGTGSSNPKTGAPTSAHTSGFGAGNQGGGGGGGNGGGNSHNRCRRGGNGGGKQGGGNGATAPGQGSVKPPTGQPAQCLAHSIHGPALYICGRDPWAVASLGRDQCRHTLLVQL
ncbi:hypothetical protein OsJ_08216 [Oryza sativa Japonica Group]|uniref:Uncharacterized protein n=1 Tax=Oryza sativa subsp. japonica TaxID=39947 RepID=B9F2H1_ORYSJ|nr:hypothetical protein OsJ_08216 [Oryza sativa Japonica Group]